MLAPEVLRHGVDLGAQPRHIEAEGELEKGLDKLQRKLRNRRSGGQGDFTPTSTTTMGWNSLLAEEKPIEG
ncbi:MAG TPA: hypothetical protein VHL34_14685 [Rhizomicrobium sp.]|jgi:hypothetical protein|nr:hypothetical protein [Rhizomicrobium sp.]